MKRDCKECAYYNTPACVGEYIRDMLTEDYEHDCFTTEEDKLLCEMMCGGVEND